MEQKATTFPQSAQINQSVLSGFGLGDLDSVAFDWAALTGLHERFGRIVPSDHLTEWPLGIPSSSHLDTGYVFSELLNVYLG